MQVQVLNCIANLSIYTNQQSVATFHCFRMQSFSILSVPN